MSNYSHVGTTLMRDATDKMEGLFNNAQFDAQYYTLANFTPKSDAQTQGTFWTHADEIQWPQPLCYDWRVTLDRVGRSPIGLTSRGSQVRNLHRPPIKSGTYAISQFRQIVWCRFWCRLRFSPNCVLPKNYRRDLKWLHCYQLEGRR